MAQETGPSSSSRSHAQNQSAPKPNVDSNMEVSNGNTVNVDKMAVTAAGSSSFADSLANIPSTISTTKPASTNERRMAIIEKFQTGK